MSTQPATEPTDQGEQFIAPGVAPVTTAQRLASRWDRPMQPRAPQKPCNVGLFDDDARRQESLF